MEPKPIVVTLTINALPRRIARQIPFKWHTVFDAATDSIIGWINRDAIEQGSPACLLVEQNHSYLFLPQPGIRIDGKDVPQLFVF
jgi:hypothetical protein